MTHKLKTRFSLVIAMALFTGLIQFGGCDGSFEQGPLVPRVEIAELTIQPAIINMSSSGTIEVLEASGGTPPYEWSVSDESLGSVPVTGASDVTYTRISNAVGVNVISVVDANLWHAEAKVYQK